MATALGVCPDAADVHVEKGLRGRSPQLRDQRRSGECMATGSRTSLEGNPAPVSWNLN